MTQPTTPRAKTTTWTTAAHYSVYGENWGSERHTVTLSRDAAGTLTAEVDGQPALLAWAVGILQGASTATKIHEQYLDAPAAPIGNPAAHQLHIELGRLGYRAHYALASEALGTPVESLAALTVQDAATVRSFAYGQLGLVTGQVAA